MKLVIGAILVWLFYGLGGSATSPGVDTIANQLRHEEGVVVRGAFAYEAWRQVAAQVRAAPRAAPKVLVGYSCGVGATAWAAAQAGVPVDKIIGIQGSLYCPPNPLTANVRDAVEIYNPNCAETFGLGCAVYRAGPHYKGHIKLIQRELSHGQADLDPIAQRDVLEAVRSLVQPKVHADDLGRHYASVP